MWWGESRVRQATGGSQTAGFFTRTHMNRVTTAVQGAGLGYRRAMTDALLSTTPPEIDFLEIAPENWMNIGGKLGRQFRAMTERYRFVTHGLSLSIGSPASLDEDFVLRVKTFLNQHKIADYTEHLSYCSDHGHLYDLMPIPMTEEAVEYVAARVRRVQDILERRIALENASTYASPMQQMNEWEFIRAVLERSDCDLLLDVNNLYVNSINHRYDPSQFLDGIPGERIRYIHIAGHYTEAADLRVDTHGSDIVDPVWRLLEEAYHRFGVRPTLLERDFNIPPLPDLLRELKQIRRQQQSIALDQTAHA